MIGRIEGIGLDHVLQAGRKRISVAEELLKRGMDLIEGLVRTLK